MFCFEEQFYFLNAFTSSVFGLSLKNQIRLRYLTYRGKTLNIGLGFIRHCYRRNTAIWTLHEWKCQVDIVNMQCWLSVENGLKFTPSPLKVDPRHGFRLFFSQFMQQIFIRTSMGHVLCWTLMIRWWAEPIADLFELCLGCDFLPPEFCSPRPLINLHIHLWFPLSWLVLYQECFLLPHCYLVQFFKRTDLNLLLLKCFPGSPNWINSVIPKKPWVIIHGTEGSPWTEAKNFGFKVSLCHWSKSHNSSKLVPPSVKYLSHVVVI